MDFHEEIQSHFCGELKNFNLWFIKKTIFNCYFWESLIFILLVKLSHIFRGNIFSFFEISEIQYLFLLFF